MSLRLVGAEDAVLLRVGLVGLLERVVVAAVGDTERPDLVVTDVRMPLSISGDGLLCAVKQREEFPGCPRSSSASTWRAPLRVAPAGLE
ncbi:hypothetical protein QRN89_34355 [Streptomyces chengbuensis]|uniref:hypothetical protein n=1 Tax=Streptomyces chengbuensis TaxID=3053466 RepID=UPI0025B2CC57|nr:hypothetical protein [Streptomyces sp. HUAS CB01]WJY55084.1 hypothetical protein QRN89_34355 [Streptomyces sp. HUAS CB01]